MQPVLQKKMVQCDNFVRLWIRTLAERYEVVIGMWKLFCGS